MTATPGNTQSNPSYNNSNTGNRDSYCSYVGGRNKQPYGFRHLPQLLPHRLATIQVPQQP